jgi:sugar phosphate permease
MASVPSCRAIATVHGIGASVSGLVTGEVVDHFGYRAGFLALAAVAAVDLGCKIVSIVVEPVFLLSQRQPAHRPRKRL